jgi:hypothetical protein
VIGVPYLLQTPLFSHVNFPGVIPPKPGVIFARLAFFNIRAKNYTPYIYKRR